MRHDEYYPSEIKILRASNPEAVEKQYAEWAREIHPARIERPTFQIISSPQEYVVLCQYQRRKGRPNGTEKEASKSESE